MEVASTAAGQPVKAVTAVVTMENPRKDDFPRGDGRFKIWWRSRVVHSCDFFAMLFGALFCQAVHLPVQSPSVHYVFVFTGSHSICASLGLLLLKSGHRWVKSPSRDLQGLFGILWGFSNSGCLFVCSHSLTMNGWFTASFALSSFVNFCGAKLVSSPKSSWTCSGYSIQCECICVLYVLKIYLYPEHNVSLRVQGTCVMWVCLKMWHPKSI